MTENTTTQPTTADVIKSLTAKGRDAMTQIGLGNVSFFDGGIVEGEGSWGGCLVDDLGHKSSGVLNRLLALGLFTHTDADSQDETNAGGWWSLTALGADVANTLAKEEKEAPAENMTMGELADVIEKVQAEKPAKKAAAKKTPAKKAEKPAAEKPAKTPAWADDAITRHIAEVFAKTPKGKFLKAREITNTITKEFPKADERPSDVTVYSRCHGGRLPSGLTGQQKPCGATKN